MQKAGRGRQQQELEEGEVLIGAAAANAGDDVGDGADDVNGDDVILSKEELAAQQRQQQQRQQRRPLEPYEVPTSGRFYAHDDRGNEEEGAAAAAGAPAGRWVVGLKLLIRA
jgi:hypothetical protein